MGGRTKGCRYSISLPITFCGWSGALPRGWSMDLTIFFFFAVMVQRMRIQHDIWQFRDRGRPFETQNSLTRSWIHLSFPISPVVWFRYYRELEDFVRTTERQISLYIHGTVFMPFQVIAYDHIHMYI